LPADIDSKENSLRRKVKSNNTGRVNLWVQESVSTLDKCQRNAVEIEKTLLRMRSILQQLENAVTLEVCATERLIYSCKVKKNC